MPSKALQTAFWLVLAMILLTGIVVGEEIERPEPVSYCPDKWQEFIGATPMPGTDQLLAGYVPCSWLHHEENV